MFSNWLFSNDIFNFVSLYVYYLVINFPVSTKHVICYKTLVVAALWLIKLSSL